MATESHDTWHMTHSVQWRCSQNFSSLALPVWDWHCLEYIWTKGFLTHLMDGGDCRTAPATPGLLKTHTLNFSMCADRSHQMPPVACHQNTTTVMKVPGGLVMRLEEVWWKINWRTILFLQKEKNNKGNFLFWQKLQQRGQTNKHTHTHKNASYCMNQPRGILFENIKKYIIDIPTNYSWLKFYAQPVK